MKTPAYPLAALLLLTSCKTAAIMPSPEATATQSHLDEIKSSAADAKTVLVQAKAELDQKQLQSAEAHVTQAVITVDKISPLVDQTKSEAKTVADQRDHFAQQWNDHKDDLHNYQIAHNNDWLGPRAHRWLIGICIVVALLGTGYVFLMAAGEMQAGALAGAINVIGHLMTFGLKFAGILLGRAVARVLSKINGLARSAMTLLEKAAPNNPATPKPATSPT